MRSETQIKKRIELYEKQIDDWRKVIEKTSNYSYRQLYGAWIRKNLELIEELRWVLGG